MLYANTVMDHPLHYRVVPTSPDGHYFSVELTIREPDPTGQRVALPAWIPGSYMIRDFARNIVSIDAESCGKAVALHKLDKQTWQAEPVEGALLIRYRVYALDLSVRSAYLDDSRGYFNGSSLFLRVIGQESAKCALEVAAPTSPGYNDWQLATSMPLVHIDDQGWGNFEAANYEQLIDCPMELGRFESTAYEVDGVPHRMVVSGARGWDKVRLARDLAAICSYQAKLFGELPLDDYLFLTLAVGDGYGGLEHRNCSSLLCKRDDLPALDASEMSEGYRNFLGLCSHEYFHLWNVKRIRPQRLKESLLEREAYTELLWAFEGITSYYDDLSLLRAGVIEASAYLELLAQTITRVLRTPGRALQSVAASSFDAWTKFYKQDENAPNAIVSYYAKGALVALGLDVTLRQRGADRLSLDDLMRALWERHGRVDVGVPEDGVERLAEELVGQSLADFFDMAVRSTAELPLADWLAQFGVGMRVRPAKASKDRGGCIDKEDEEKAAPRSVLGATLSVAGEAVKLNQVFQAGAAQRAGLAPGDRIVALDGLQVNVESLEKRIGTMTPGSACRIHAFRRDELREFEVEVQSAPADTCDLWLLPEEALSEAQRARRVDWMGSAIEA